MSLLVHKKQKIPHPLTHIYMIAYFSKRYRRFNKNGGFKLVYGPKPLLLATKRRH